MIKWTGTDTSKKISWTAEAETFKELAEKLIERDIIPDTHDGDTGTQRVLSILDREDLDDKLDEGEIDTDQYFEQLGELVDGMSEDHWREFIEDSNGMAYYQENEVVE